MKFTIKSNKSIKANRSKNQCYNQEIFRIYNISDSGIMSDIIIRGYTNQEYDKSKPVNINVKYGDFLLEEESILINKRSYEANNKCISINEILNLIPGTK